MKLLISIQFLCLAIFVNFAASTSVLREANCQHVNELRYPGPLNITTNIVKFLTTRLLPSIASFNVTEFRDAIIDIPTMFAADVSLAVNDFRNNLRESVRNVITVLPLDRNERTEVSTDVRVSIDLPVFSVVDNATKDPEDSAKEHSEDAAKEQPEDVIDESDLRSEDSSDDDNSFNDI